MKIKIKIKIEIGFIYPTTGDLLVTTARGAIVQEKESETAVVINLQTTEISYAIVLW